jgi:hypothetical protein
MYNFPKYSQISLPLFRSYPNPIKMEGSIRLRVPITNSQNSLSESYFDCTRGFTCIVQCTCLNPKSNTVKKNGKF